MEKITLLIVEDNAGDILLVKEYLSEKKDFRYSLSEVETLGAALELLAQQDFDAVLLDLSLPDSQGLETVRKLISDFPEVPVIVLTGLQDEKSARLAVRYGAQDYLDKQFISPEVLSRSIIYAIERKKALQDKEEILANLAQALVRIEKLEGILPICLNCKKIVDGNKQWRSIEEYISHGAERDIVPLICPDCKSFIKVKNDT